MAEKITLTQEELDAKIVEATKGKLTQDQVDSIVKERLAREGKKYSDYDDLRKFKETHEKLQEENAQKELENRKEYEKLKDNWSNKEKDYQGVIARKEAELKDMLIKSSLMSEINRQNAYAEETMALLKSQAVFDSNNDIRIKGRDANGIETNLSVEEGVKKFLEQRPHLIKATKRDGGGTGAGSTSDTTGTLNNKSLDTLNAQLIDAQRAMDTKKVAELKKQIRNVLTSQRINF